MTAVATELRPGVPTAMFARLAEQGVAKGRMALEPLALAIERQAKINASTGSHKRGTPTPARPGTGPAVISGTLRRTITHSPIERIATGWTTKVGIAAGVTPSYGKTPASKYAEILERLGTRSGAKYPFLEPAFRFGVEHIAPMLYTEAYGRGWTRIA